MGPSIYSPVKLRQQMHRFYRILDSLIVSIIRPLLLSEICMHGTHPESPTCHRCLLVVLSLTRILVDGILRQ